MNATLKAGQTSTTVEVEAAPLMNAVDTTVGYVMDTAQIDAVPLSTGSFTGVAILSPGVNVVTVPSVVVVSVVVTPAAHSWVHSPPPGGSPATRPW